MKRKKALYLGAGIVGILLIILGVYIFNLGVNEMLGGLCFGIGGACAALGIGSFIKTLLVSDTKSKDIEELYSIEKNDERNIRIREKSGYLTAQIMNYILCGFVLYLGFMKAPLEYLLPAVGLIVFELLLIIILSNHYSKTI
ncbi:hypothetical protein L0P54_11335 [Anaerosalibacter bizertensis]|uniref:DUF2178 domain-containing protein n=1 Tax=Anaerosalibacter bizertensis TaxID=932217 RepID=A0A9Q4FMI6_9FIRM|nr:hypothetical protein [Anaerosalibacter bizertensis]MBV1821338.1 hypothetical protein [Bacteroidales bacterium MSK.15.36]MCB5560654.1 hypothetical protein [Anaerosalibacter bizertensis]MCG4565973.1 hypothetical protein [Anaerosalibacter bizertensis]MCG4583581.1 hypothetical protein [Anaerosalibacter bizertensis]MCG4586275.1 hypothetical protein [Anaerosalibacter bizertensis]